MVKRPNQISTSVPKQTREQADVLVRQKYGTISAMLVVAIDRLYREEIANVGCKDEARISDQSTQ